ncbi:MAG: Holliday junction resolvase RuvX [Actinomycetes bacterium]|nr:MAG: Holliday junction resolvase RuvX [Actinomycetota bacterium]
MSRVLGVDYGDTRIGLAISDPLRITARPLEVVAPDRFLDRLRELINEYEVTTVVIGLPRTLKGGASASTAGARTLGEEISGLGVEVVYVDERFTSRMAESALLEAGMKRRERRVTVDKVAAAIILQSYLDGNSPSSRDVTDHE